MNIISKETLKAAVKTSIEVFSEIEKEKGLKFSMDDVVKTAISIYIQESRNGNGNGHSHWNGNTSMRLGFGKYKGKLLDEVIKSDREYIQWLSAKAKNEKLREQAKKLLEKYSATTEKIPVPKPKVA